MTAAARRPLPLIAHAALLAALLGLSACTALPSKPAPQQSYDLGRPLPAAGSPAAGAPLLAIDPISAGADLDSTAFSYRLLYASGGAQTPLPYAHARWSMPPPELLTQRLRQHFAALRPVTNSGSGLARQALQVQLEEFAHVFHNPDQSEGVVQIRASVLAPGASGPRLLGQRSFAARQAAPTPDAAGGAQALQQASDAVLQQVRDWVQSLPTP